MRFLSGLAPKNSAADSPVAEIQAACFRLAGEMYALDIRRIKEVIRPQKVTPVPKAPAFIEGVINLRGMVVPVIDLRKRFGLPLPSDNRRARIIICVFQRKSVGLLVDEATEVCRFSRQDVRPASPFLGGAEAEYILGVCRKGDDLIMLLDLDRLLSAGETAALATVRSGSAANSAPQV